MKRNKKTIGNGPNNENKTFFSKKLIVGGLTSAFNSQIVKFVAINNHGMKDKIEQEVKAEAAFEVNINVVD